MASQDQWGNITAGIDLIRKKTGKEAYAFTMPLITKKDGTKFGKSEGNAIWLDINKTSGYEMYQFFINTEDEMVIDYLKKLTFLSKEEIEEIEKIHKERPEERVAQKKLAEEVITFLHGKDEYEHAKEVSEALFTGNVKSLSDEEIKVVFKGVPTFSYEGETLIDVLVNNKITSSKREAREFLSNKAISINGQIVNDENMKLDSKRKYNIIRRGKKKYFVIENK